MCESVCMHGKERERVCVCVCVYVCVNRLRNMRILFHLTSNPNFLSPPTSVLSLAPVDLACTNNHC